MKNLNDKGDTLVNINYIDKNEDFEFRLENKRNLDRKTLNLLRNKQILSIIN